MKRSSLLGQIILAVTFALAVFFTNTMSAQAGGIWADSLPKGGIWADNLPKGGIWADSLPKGGIWADNLPKGGISISDLL